MLDASLGCCLYIAGCRWEGGESRCIAHQLTTWLDRRERLDKPRQLLPCKRPTYSPVSPTGFLKGTEGRAIEVIVNLAGLVSINATSNFVCWAITKLVGDARAVEHVLIKPNIIRLILHNYGVLSKWGLTRLRTDTQVWRDLQAGGLVFVGGDLTVGLVCLVAGGVPRHGQPSRSSVVGASVQLVLLLCCWEFGRGFLDKLSVDALIGRGIISLIKYFLCFLDRKGFFWHSLPLILRTCLYGIIMFDYCNRTGGMFPVFMW